MGDGTKEKPLTREDVLKLIKENGGKTEGLGFSGKVFEEGIDLSGLELEGINFEKAQFPTCFEEQKLMGAKFDGSNLSRANFCGVNLQYAQFGTKDNKPTRLDGADFRGTILLNANFQSAELSCAVFGKIDDTKYGPVALENTDFRKANLFLTNFKGCYFYGTKFEGAFIRGADIIQDTHLDGADWGDYKIGEEVSKDYPSAERYYRYLKMWYTHSGYSGIAAKFYYREKEVARKNAKRWNDHAAGWLTWAFFGYGEGWKRILFWIAGLILFFSLIYSNIGASTPYSFLDNLYFSATSFISLGYGSWVKEATGWMRVVGVMEAFVGFFMMTLLLVTFIRKWSR